MQRRKAGPQFELGSFHHGEAACCLTPGLPPLSPYCAQGGAAACKRAALMIRELINGEPGSAQAIIQRVCAEVRAAGVGSDVCWSQLAWVGRAVAHSC